jgi:cell division protein FtsQ
MMAKGPNGIYKTPRQNVRRQPVKKTLSLQWLLNGLKVVVVVVSVATALGTAAYYGSRTLGDFLHKPIASVIVSGELLYLTKEDVISLIGSNIEKSFIQENLLAMQHKLEANPWVDSVALRRQWPDALQVIILEQKPIARWGEVGFVNFRGELVRVSYGRDLDYLPLLKGEESHALQVMKQYQLLSQIMALYGIKLVELEQNKLGVWSAVLDNDWRLLLGRNDITKKTQRLMQMLSEQKIDRQDEIAVIDMRYQNGLAIQWKQYSQHAQSEEAVHVKKTIQKI